MLLLHCDTCMWMNVVVLITIVVYKIDEWCSHEIMMQLYKLDDILVTVIVVYK